MNNLAFVVPIQPKRGGGSSSSNGWFGLLSFLFCGKKNYPKHARKNCKVLRVLCREGDFFSVPTVFALEGSIEKNCFRMEWYSFCSYMGPNQERIMDQMVSRLSVWPQVSFIKTGSYKGIGQRLIGFRVFVSVVVRQCYRPRLIKLVKIWKPLLLLLRLRVRQGRCCVDLL